MLIKQNKKFIPNEIALILRGGMKLLGLLHGVTNFNNVIMSNVGIARVSYSNITNFHFLIYS